MDPSIFQQIATSISRWWREAMVERFRLWGVAIHGVEVTQSIQYYRADEHLTDAADRGKDNSVRLVAYKAAWVRVYVRSGLFASRGNVTGTLELTRRSRWFTYTTAATYSPQPPGSVTAEQSVDYDTERGDINRTLNFIIPAEEFHGSMQLTVRLTGYSLAVKTIAASARLIQTLRVRAILVSYNGPSTSVAPATGQPPPPNLNLAAPTLADVQTTAARAMAAMPVQSAGSFASAGTLAWALPLDDARSCAGCCSANWEQLMTQLTTMRTNDGNRADVVYYGLLPAGIPLDVRGCGNNGLGSGAAGAQRVFMHEIGHGYGFMHTPCGAAGGTDPNYPTYEPYGAASIGEYGLDVRNGNIFDPDAVRDYMSYCRPSWMSLYQHNRLLEHARLDPRWIFDQPWLRDDLEVLPFEIRDLWLPDPRDLWLPDPPPWIPHFRTELMRNPVISIIGEVRDGGEVAVLSVARVRAAGQPAGTKTKFSAQLLDDRHEVQARAPPHPPRIERAFADVAGKDGIALRWVAHTEGVADVWVQWSHDEGKSWHGLATSLTRGEALLPFTGLPGGPVWLRLLLHDGFFTATSEPLRIDLPVREPEVAILHPSSAQTLIADRAMQLWASATDSAGNPVPSEALRWSLDGADTGRGREVWTRAPKEGEHTVALTVRWSGGEVRRELKFRTERAG